MGGKILLENEHAKVEVLIAGLYVTYDKDNATKVTFPSSDTAIMAFNTITSTAAARAKRDQISKPLIEEGPDYGNW